MRKIKLLAFVCITSGSILFNSCIGSFGLFNKVRDWNETVDNKYVNELVFVALWIVPVYELAFIADIFVINSIEFWSGNNPAASTGDVKKIKGENGDYMVETLENGYSITKDGEIPVELIYDKDTDTWNVVAQGASNKLVQLNDDGTAQLFIQGGDSVNITLDAQGMATAREIAMGKAYYAFH